VLLSQTGFSQEPARFNVLGVVAQGYLAVGPSGTTLVAVATESETRQGPKLVTYFWQPANETAAAKYPLGTNRSGLTATPCALSADAGYLTTNEGGGAMAIRETPTGRAIAAINHPGGDSACAFSADSRLLATSGSDVVRVWGTVSIIAIHSTPVPMNLYAMFARELRMHASRLYTRAAWREAIRLVATGGIVPEPLVSRVISLEDLQKGMEEALGGGPVMKVLVDLAR
jgi:hypothetical protein